MAAADHKKIKLIPWQVFAADLLKNAQMMPIQKKPARAGMADQGGKTRPRTHEKQGKIRRHKRNEKHEKSITRM